MMVSDSAIGLIEIQCKFLIGRMCCVWKRQGTRKQLMKILRPILTVTFIVLAVAYGAKLVQYVLRVVVPQYECYRAFGIGISIFFLLSVIRSNFIKQNLDWLQIFSHELTHVVFSVLCFNRMSNLSVSNLGNGEVIYIGRSNFVISLTPYCFPLFTVMGLTIRPWLSPTVYVWVDIVNGITFAFHITTFYLQARPHQTDLIKYGILFSYSFILLINFVLVGLVLLITKSNFTHFGPYLYDGVEFSIAAVSALLGLK